MTNSNFKNSVIALAIGIFAVSCGGSGSKKPGGVSDIEKQAAKTVETKSVSSGWESNEYTKQLPKPDISVSAAGESSMGYSANFSNATLEQVKAYAAKVKTSGFSADAYESDGDTYTFSAKNAAGWSVLITWSQGRAGVLISKPK
jgi:hypothetical protein